MKKKIKDLTMADIGVICSNMYNCVNCPLRFERYKACCWKEYVMASQENKGGIEDIEVRIGTEEYSCNECEFYEPMNGVCHRLGHNFENKHGYDDACCDFKFYQSKKN